MAKKKNSRKVLAVALGIMGIAGLSLASASQLNITATPKANFATGMTTFDGPCDTDGVTVEYQTAPATDGTLQYTGFIISGIADKCMTDNRQVSWTLKYSTSATLLGVTTYTSVTPALSAADVTIVGGAPANNNKVTVTFATTVPLSDVMPGSNRLDSIAITIK
jgi:hypothetical protein